MELCTCGHLRTVAAEIGPLSQPSAVLCHGLFGRNRTGHSLACFCVCDQLITLSERIQWA